MQPARLPRRQESGHNAGANSQAHTQKHNVCADREKTLMRVERQKSADHMLQSISDSNRELHAAEACRPGQKHSFQSNETANLKTRCANRTQHTGYFGALMTSGQQCSEYAKIGEAV